MHQNKKVSKKALLIGINYLLEPTARLDGCHNDVDNLSSFLAENKYFKKSDISIMVDKNPLDTKYPTKANILREMDELVKYALERPTHSIEMYLSFSGHGDSQIDLSGDESDGYDEVLVPTDFRKNGVITDDTIREILINKLPSNVKLCVIIDACHSGSALDLRYHYLLDSKNRYIVNQSYQKSLCEVVMISGCGDDQTSADAFMPNEKKLNRYQYQGACSKAFMKFYKKGITYSKLINSMRSWLKANKYTQLPQLTAGKKIDTNKQFLLSSYK